MANIAQLMRVMKYIGGVGVPVAYMHGWLWVAWHGSRQSVEGQAGCMHDDETMNSNG